jgi:asparagine synthase (glutamine-hydrolysing)
VLTGEGSDELLAGYGRYPRALLNWRAGEVYGAVPALMRSWVANVLVPRLPVGVQRYARRSFVTRSVTPEALFFDNFAAIGL